MTREDQSSVLRTMFSPPVGDGPMYWLRLMIAMAIATLGLVLGSTAVVIGAMLVSPLMDPIVTLGMAIAVGVPKLALRAFLRAGVSVGLVVASAALITLALPFREVTGPIAERTSPTVLDLLVAICCALMGAFATACSSNRPTTTAAGTAIAIALVPPLCVVGFGVGASRPDVAIGAALLFIANFSAIMLVAVLVFTAFGFADVARDTLAANSALRVGVVWRLALPLVLVGVVYVPLRSALAEVAWEVTARREVKSALDVLVARRVSSQIAIAHHRIDLEVVVLGEPARARSIERELVARIRERAAVAPSVSVLAVPDTAAMRRLLDTAHAGPQPIAPAPAEPLVPRAGKAIARLWPTTAAGPLVGWRLAADATHTTRVVTAHLGDPLGSAGRELLERSLEPTFGRPVTVEDRALPASPMECPPPVDASCIVRLASVVAEAGAWDGLWVCATSPLSANTGGVTADASSPEPVPTASLIAAIELGRPRASLAGGETWSVAVRSTPCASASDAGPPDATPDE